MILFFLSTTSFAFVGAGVVQCCGLHFVEVAFCDSGAAGGVGPAARGDVDVDVDVGVGGIASGAVITTGWHDGGDVGGLLTRWAASRIWVLLGG